MCIHNELPIRFDIITFPRDKQKCVTVLLEPLSFYHQAKLFSVLLVYSYKSSLCRFTAKKNGETLQRRTEELSKQSYTKKVRETCVLKSL